MISFLNKKILLISPHIDDVELGMGATVNKYVRDNDIYYLGLSAPDNVEYDNFIKNEFLPSCEILGLDRNNLILKKFHPRDMAYQRGEILQLLYDINVDLNPDIVFIPNSNDVHQSHTVVFEESRRAFKYKSIVGYELPWNNFEFSNDIFIPLSKENIISKVSAIKKFSSQKNRIFFSNDIVKDLAHVRGKQVGAKYAECFELIRLII